LEYYLKGVRANNSHYPCIFNLACSYFKLEKNKNAKKWFEIAIKTDSKTKDAYYGSALCSFKLKKFDEALETISKIPFTAK
jgi:tetratricopeptide (TPR) repeat protein